MSDNTTILMRRMGVKTEKVKTGLFGHELRTVLDGECSDSEVLCAVRKDGTNARVVNFDKNGSFAKEQGPRDDEMLFAVRRTPFQFSLRIDAGKDADGYGWAFDVDGFAELLHPECFAVAFRGIVTEAVPYSVSMLEKHFGTITSTIMHDRIVVEVLGLVHAGTPEFRSHPRFRVSAAEFRSIIIPGHIYLCPFIHSCIRLNRATEIKVRTRTCSYLCQSIKFRNCHSIEKF